MMACPMALLTPQASTALIGDFWHISDPADIKVRYTQQVLC